MGVGRTLQGVRVVSDREMLVVFVTADSEDPAKKIFLTT